MRPVRQVAHRATGYAVHVTMPEPVRHVDADRLIAGQAIVQPFPLGRLFLEVALQAHADFWSQEQNRSG